MFLLSTVGKESIFDASLNFPCISNSENTDSAIFPILMNAGTRAAVFEFIFCLSSPFIPFFDLKIFKNLKK